MTRHTAKESTLKLEEVMQHFVEHRDLLKVLSVASSDGRGEPNCAPKMVVDIHLPNLVYFLDYTFTKTYANIQINPRLSLSFMDDAAFTGYRLTGSAELLGAGEELNRVRAVWSERLIAYAADRIIKRVKGGQSARKAENALPENFKVVKFQARAGSVVEPDRVLRAFEEP